MTLCGLNWSRVECEISVGSNVRSVLCVCGTSEQTLNFAPVLIFFIFVLY